jgi:hypothetical protein
MAEHQPDSGSLRITMKDVYNRIGEVGADVSEIRGQLSHISVTTAENTKDIIDHESRIRALEAWRYALPAATVLGAMGVIGSVLAATIR